jgi:DtxR family transcriptional regulator, Mn-dependent transcriptional regulator
VEDYVKVIYSFTEWQDQPITSSQLAARLGVANSSVSEMVRKLKEQGLVTHKPYSAIRLTPAGSALALSMVRRHRLLETYLVEELGYGWDEVHDEAELLEHAVSELFIERLSAKLGHPRRDPHGDPIPHRDGTVDKPVAHRLLELDAGHLGRITRISDDNPELLRYFAGQQIGPDTELNVVGRRPFGGALTVRLGGPGRSLTVDLGDEASAAVWVRTTASHEGCTLPDLDADAPDAGDRT